MNSLLWTCKSSYTIAEELQKKGFNVSYKSIQRTLKGNGYSLQSNRKMLSGKGHPDRDNQFRL